MSNKFFTACLVFEVLILFLYGFLTDYESGLSGSFITNEDGGILQYYPFYQDVHVMIFVGFGFLVTFMNGYSITAVSLNFILAAMAIQWSGLTNNFFMQTTASDHWHKVHMEIKGLIDSDFAAAALLITFGGILGKVSPMQLFGTMFFEMIFYSLNLWICVDRMHVVDMGGSIVIHIFGAYFGLAVARVVSQKAPAMWRDRSTQGSTTVSDTIAMVGTLFLWMYWPSFNGAFAVGASRHRVIVNTVLSLTGSCIAGFALSGLLRPGKKFSMVDIQNATLAGGVAVGSSADLVIKPYGALLIGVVAGTISVLGYVYLLPYLERKINLHDTAGINNLHGMPGILGGIAGVVAAANTKDQEYGQHVATVYPARDPLGLNWTASHQAWMQLAGILVTLCIAIASGTLVGHILNLNFFEPPKKMFNDGEYFFVEEEEHHHEHHSEAHVHDEKKPAEHSAHQDVAHASTTAV